eukprot:GHRR01003744.1.p1 GENE.GHRR01003744.1~~GHRR01003744.1.p1  ORF type:complete len:387 (+),score=108.88 GHRR01003744.1:675-1835(+)
MPIITDRLHSLLPGGTVDDEHLAEATLQPTSDYIGWKSQSPFVTSVTAHAVAKDVADASADVAMPHGDKHIIAAKRKSVDQAALTPQHSLTVHDMPNLKPLMALTLNRPYTDKDWFAAMAALDKVQKLQQQRALQQLRASNRCSTASFLHVDDENDVWFDARSHVVSDSSVAFISDAEREEVAKLAHELEQQEQHQQQLTVSIICELEPCNPSCVPDPPLLCAEKHWKYCQVDIKPFCFYWERDPVRSTPFPLPIDEQMKLNHLFQKTHQSIPGMWMREVGQQLLLHATPDLAVLPGVVNYTEYYNKDSSPCSWTLRRDIKIGRTTGQMFMTTDGVLIFRYGRAAKLLLVLQGMQGASSLRHWSYVHLLIFAKSALCAHQEQPDCN